MMVCVNVIAAETTVKDMDELWTMQEKSVVSSMAIAVLLGSKESIREQLTNFQEKYQVDELMAISYIYDTEKQKNSYQILKEVVD
ncbi:hypothetical protein SAMN04487943_10122 [Gracilibacillus orientalis]|uniref:Uncharacterized protein n=1 Tax=Gracilibacillus orientalis TaxID=334253 RepID=A0A1I4GVJ4_9BACI|nr:hypothetical protein SAMN04487943_10122 [Gracilibacillus orientalis]